MSETQDLSGVDPKDISRKTVTKAVAGLEIPQGAGRTLFLAAMIAAVCGGLYGYDTGIISGALLLITHEFHISPNVQEMVASAILAGAVIGALATGWISETIGRRRTVMIVTAVFVAGAVACALSPTVDWLIASRVLLGLAVGGATQVVPMYISELAPTDRRGTLVTMFNIAIGVGILFANIVGFTLREAWSWRTMVVIAAIPAAIVCLSMFFMPKSPRWTAENVGMGEALDELARLRDSRREIRHEAEQIHRVAHDTRPENRGWRGLAQPWVRPALVAALGVAFFTQCGGLEMMIYYAPTFLSGVGFGASSALLASLGVATVYLIMTFLGSRFVDRIGRRRLMLLMTPGSVLSLIGLGVMFWLTGATGDAKAHAPGGVEGWLIVGFLLAFMLFNSGSIQVVGWLLGAEMFPLSMRGQATSLHAAVLWGSDLLVTGTALSMVGWIGLGGTMWFYAAVNALSFAFVWFFVPETAGASLEDIEAALQDGTFRPTRGHNRITAEGYGDEAAA
ncbi:sugar porter (SP) family MFS transporter [Endobacter medicaginis]|uniref:Sugar porter (SP) family MFS transporter n=1 Tax=Endobacter medicaginis TaxID=1181271 RepID=A0A839V203_9PROT|nr:sugar porter family MFS transporter [Endobacter medicaginis]MBB3174534.1 sugar porter (SP) family MFS transporter [Endobacter medicaginis]